MTLVELMIAGALFAMVSMGVSAYFLFLTKAQTKQNHKATLGSIQQEIIRTIMDDKAWNQTMLEGNGVNGDDNNTGSDVNFTALGCVFTDPADCRNAGVNDIALYDRNGNLFYDPSNLTGGGVQGFNRNGTICSGWSAGAANDNCPYHVDIEVEPLCRHANSTLATCRNPFLLIRGYFSIGAGSSGEASDSIHNQMVGTERLNFWLVRSTLVDQKQDTFEAEITVAAGAVGGGCTPGAWQARTGWQAVAGNDSQFISIENGTGGTNSRIRMQHSGGFARGPIFNCRMVSNATGTKRNQTRIHVDLGGGWIHRTNHTVASNSYYYGTTEAGNSDVGPGESGSVSELEFVVFLWGNTTFGFELEHYCEQNSVTFPTHSLGKPSDSGAAEVYATIKCSRLDFNF